MAEIPVAVREALEWFTSLRTELQELGLTEVEPEYGQHLALVTAALDAGARAGEERDALEANLINLVAAIDAKRGPLTPDKLHNATANRERLDAALADARAFLAPPAAPERGPGA